MQRRSYFVAETSGAETGLIRDAFVAEGDIPIDEAYENIASWYQIPIESVREAIDFEFSLRPLKSAA